MRAAILFVVLGLTISTGPRGQVSTQVSVQSLVPPVYPAIASTAQYNSGGQLSGLEGTAKVDVEIGVTGKVLEAKGTGDQEILTRVSEGNVRQWTFCPISKPTRITITYVYRLIGKPSREGGTKRIILDLPDRVEIIAQPLIPNT